MVKAPRPRTKKEVVAEFRETEILHAARWVIVRDGYRNASMEKIAEQAGIAKGTLYLYFDSKEELVRRATERGHEEMARTIERLTKEAIDPDAAIATYVRAMLRFCDENELLFRAMDAHPDSAGDPASNSVNRRIGQYVSLLERIIDDRVQAKKYRKVNSRRVARILVEAVRGVVIERLRERGRDRPSVEEDAEALLSVVMDGIRA